MLGNVAGASRSHLHGVGCGDGPLRAAGRGRLVYDAFAVAAALSAAPPVELSGTISERAGAGEPAHAGVPAVSSVWFS